MSKIDKNALMETLIGTIGNELKTGDAGFIKKAMMHRQCYNCALIDQCRNEPFFEPIGTCDRWTGHKEK